jgi:heme/copper-type cytochrome/quinol oxidase subunit 2
MPLPWNSIVAGCVTPEGVATIQCISAVFQNLIQAALLFAGVVALFLIIHSGFKFVTSSGDPKKVEEARETMTYAITGLIIVLLAFFIINYISYITRVNCIEFFGLEWL